MTTLKSYNPVKIIVPVGIGKEYNQDGWPYGTNYYTADDSKASCCAVEYLMGHSVYEYGDVWNQDGWIPDKDEFESVHPDDIRYVTVIKFYWHWNYEEPDNALLFEEYAPLDEDGNPVFWWDSEEEADDDHYRVVVGLETLYADADTDTDDVDVNVN